MDKLAGDVARSQPSLSRKRPGRIWSFAVRTLAPLALASATLAGAAAEDWPTRSIKAIVPLTPGSATDTVARIVLDQLSTQLGQPVVVENRPGAGNTIGMAAAARSDPDGYTILINSSSHTIVPATYHSLPFDTARDLKPVIALGNMPAVLVVSAKSDYRGLADFVAAAKARPGALNYASAGTGNFSHLATETLRMAAGFEAVHVPSKGAPEAITEVLARRVDFFVSPLTVANPFIKDGSLRPLAVTGSQRASELPDIPTTVEAGYPGSTYNFWVAMFAPAKTPAAVLDRLNRETARALENPAVREKLKTLGVDPMPLSAEAFDAMVRSEIELNARIATAVGLQIN